MTPLHNPGKFQSALIEWFQTEGNTYPWRETNDPWHILISEVMLQQTQIQTVLNKHFFTRFINKYPTPKSISNATEQEILSAWEGLGYYRRVRNLQKAAIVICEKHDGVFPREYDQILALPGVGRYTAGAVSSFAYDLPQPIVDANVARVFSRLFDYHIRVDSSAGQKQLWEWAEALLSQQQPLIYNSALMELGQRVCTNKSPKCNLCVISKYCSASKPESLPIKKSAIKTVLVDEFAILCIDNKKRIILQQESSQQRRAGMWKLPLRTATQTADFPLLNKSTYAITHHKVTLRIHQCFLKNLPPRPKDVTEKWFEISELTQVPMPSPFRKVLEKILSDHF